MSATPHNRGELSIQEKLRRSRELGEQMERSGEGVVRSLRRAASALRANGPSRSLGRHS